LNGKEIKVYHFVFYLGIWYLTNIKICKCSVEEICWSNNFTLCRFKFF